MPRLENEGFDPRKNRDLDRTVPEDENYYGDVSIDLNFNSRERQDRRQQGINPCQEPQYQRPQPRKSSSASGKSAPPNRNNGGRRRAKKKKQARAKAIFAAVIALVLVILVATGGSAVSAVNKINYDEKIANEYVSADSLMSNKGVKNILLLGVDARPDDETAASRSDTMMIVSVDKNHSCIKMVSFLRDTWVYLPNVGYSQRLNAACSSGGYQSVVNAIEYNFGVAIDGYAVVDFEMFKVLVDSIGGVKVNVTAEEAKEVTSHPKRYGNVVLEEGEYKLSGEQALAYCRIRKIDTDWMRTKRQRTVMSAILSSAKSNPLKLFSIAKNAAPYVETNLTKGELFSVATSAVSCLGNMHQARVPFDDTWYYDTIYGNSVIAIDTDKNRELLQDYIYNKTSQELKAIEDAEK